MKKRRVIITKLPQAKSGVEVKLDGLRAGLGFNANVMPWPIMAGKMSKPATEVNKTLKPVPRHMANLEAEKDEIAMIPDKGGIPSTFIIGGKRHHSGGTPLFLPSDSFIFSDTAKMRIKDPTILAQFGMPFKKGGYTPAEIAKKYDTSKYKKILADPDTDDLQRETAELMIANNNLKLAKLAIYQESMKGFPQGLPQVGMPYLEEMGVDPAEFVQENPGQGDDETAEADNMSRFGGPLPKAQWGKNTASKMLPKFSEYSPNAGASDAYAGVDTKEGTEGIAGVEGIEGKGLTGKYQDWEMIKKKKAGISGIAKAEGILGGLRGAQAFGNAREMQALDQRMQEGSLYDNAVDPIQQDVTGRQGSFVQTGMATGTKDPYNTGNLVQQPGMNYAISKFGGDIDYFAPGGYLPRAQYGFTADTLTRPTGSYVNYYTGGIENYANVMHKGKEYYREGDNIIRLSDDEPVTDPFLKREILTEIERVNPNKWDTTEPFGNDQDSDIPEGQYKYKKGLYAPALPGLEKSKYAFLRKYKEPIRLYANALDSNNPELMQKTADALYKTDVSDSAEKNKIKDLGRILRERAAAVKPATSTSNKVVPGFYNQEDLGKFASASPHYASAYKAFEKAFKSGNPEEMKNTANFLKTVETPWYSASWLPFTHEDKLQDLAGILEERSRGEQNIPSSDALLQKARQHSKDVAGRVKQTSLYLKTIADKSPDSLEGAKAANLLKQFEDYNPYYKERKNIEKKQDKIKSKATGPSTADDEMWYTPEEETEINKAYDFLQNNFKDVVSGKKKLEFLEVPAESVNQSTIARDIGKPAAPSSTSAPAAPVITTDDAEMLKQKEALLKGAGQKSTETKTSGNQPAVKKSSRVEETDEDFKEGGSIGKRRVLIHSLGEYKTGGALTTYQGGGKTTEAKGKGIWQHSTKSGNWRLKYPDGTYGPVQKETPVLVTPYTGADAPSKYTEEQWQEFAKETGFTPQSADPTEQNKEFQEHLAQHKDWGPKVEALHKQYGPPKGGKYDALLGKRWDAIVDQRAPKKGVSETPSVKEDGKKQTYTDPGVYAQNLEQPRVPNVPARFTLQDTLKGANLMADYLGIKGSQPWSAKAPVYTPDTAFVSPERQYQKIGEQFNIAAQNLAQFGDPRQYNARLGQLQGQALAAIADTAARTEGENVRIQNAQSAQNAAMLNDYGQREAARRTRDYENYVTAQDTVRNKKEFARNAGVNQLANAFTNRANIYNVNQLYPQYAVDPTGMMYFKNPRDIKPDYSKQMTVNDYFNQILEKNENLRNEKGMTIAYDMAKNMAGIKPKTDEADEWLKASKGIIPSYNVNPYGYNNGQGT